MTEEGGRVGSRGEEMVGDAGDGGEEKEVDVKTNVVQGSSREAAQ